MRFWAIGVVCMISLLLIPVIASTDAPDSYEGDGNDSIDAAIEIIPDGAAQRHSLDSSEDKDWFTFSGISGTVYTSVLTYGDFDVIIDLYNADGTKLLIPQNTKGMGESKILEWKVSEDGPYHLRIHYYDPETYLGNVEYEVSVRTSFFAGDDEDGWPPSLPVFTQDDYEVNDMAETATLISVDTDIQQHTFHTPEDMDWIRFSGTEGVFYLIEISSSERYANIFAEIYAPDGVLIDSRPLLEDSLQEGYLACWQSPQTGIFKVRLENLMPLDNAESMAYEVRIGSGSVCPDAYEEDDTRFQAKYLFPCEAPQSHNFHDVGDEDWFEFEGIPGETYTIEASNLEANCDVAIDVRTYDDASEKQEVLESQDIGGMSENETLTRSPLQHGIYYVLVHHRDPEISGEGTGYEFSLCSDYATGTPDDFEDDDTEDQAKDIIPNKGVQQHDFHTPEDVDWVRFEAVSGKTYALEISTYNLQFEILNAEMMPVRSDISWRWTGDKYSACWTAPQTEVYYVRLTNPRTGYGNAIISDEGEMIHGEISDGYFPSYGEDTAYEIELRQNVICPDFYEDDNAYYQARHISLYETSRGHNFHEADDEDWFGFDASPGIPVSIEAIHLGQDCDAVIELYEYVYNYDPDDSGDTPAGFAEGYLRLLADPQNSAGASENEMLLWTPPQDGSEQGFLYYYVKVRSADSALLGRDTAYDLKLGTGCDKDGGNCGDPHEEDDTFDQAKEISLHGRTGQRHNFHDPGDEDWIRFEATNGVTYELDLYGITDIVDIVAELYDASNTKIADAVPDDTGHLEWLAPDDSTYYVKIFHRDPGAYGGNTAYELSMYSFPDIYETDDRFEQAVSITVDGAADGVLTPQDMTGNFDIQGDEDWSRFDALSGEAYTIEASGLGENADVVIELYDENETLVFSKNSGGVAEDEAFTWIPPEDNTYYVKVINEDPDTYGADTGYSLGVVATSSSADSSPSSDFAGTIEGIVTDAVSGEVIAGATISTTQDVVTQSGTSGGYLMLHPAGTWTISAEASGYEMFSTSVTVQDMGVGVGTTNKDIQMLPKTGIVETPTLSPSSGVSSQSLSVEIQCTTPGAKIYYSKDGTEPREESKFYTKAISVDETTRITAKAFKEGWTASDAVRGHYEITGKVAPPAFSPEPGTYTVFQSITLSCDTPGAAIRYTTDGSELSENSPLYTVPVEITETTTIRAGAFKTDWEPSEISTETYTITGTVSEPSFSPPSGVYKTVQQVKLSCETSGASICYTMDGTEPTAASDVYEKQISVSETTTIRAKAFKNNWAASKMATGIYEITGIVESPTFSPLPGTYATSQNVTLACATDGAVIRHTTDGSDPTESSPVYESPIAVTSGMSIRARAFKTDWEPSSVVTGDYVITGYVAEPTFSPLPGTYATPQNVTLACATEGAVIHYTTNGDDPTEQSSVYTSAISVSATTTIKAKAFNPDWTPSTVRTGNYIITGTVDMPVFFPSPGTFTTPQEVELSCGYSGASIYYTTDGSEPTESSRLYIDFIPISSTTTIRAKAFKADWMPSSESVEIYTIIETVATPVFSPASGTYITALEVELTCATPDAVIHYTTDGSDPTEDSFAYASPISVNETTSIRAKAFKADWISSSTETGSYTITGTVESPVFSLPSDVYTAAQTVELSCATPEAVIRYTMDESDPTEDSPVYSSPISVDQTMTIGAKAFKADWASSNTETGHYIITQIESPDSGGGGCFIGTLF